MTSMDSEVPKNWHSSVTEEMRMQQIGKLITGMTPPPQHNIPTCSNKLQLLAQNAKMMEEEMFQVANSRSEYYLFIAEKVYKCQRELELERAHTMPSCSQTTTCSGSLQLGPVERLANLEAKGDITTDVRLSYTSKFQEDLKPTPYLDIPLSLARKAESICFERANTVDEYHKYTSDVYKVQQALKHIEDTESTVGQSSSHQVNKIESKYEGVMQSATPDVQFNKEMLQLLIAIEKHSLHEEYMDDDK